MSDPNKLEVEVVPVGTAEMRALTSAINDLGVSFKSLDAINTSGILSEFRALSTSMGTLEKSMDGLSATLVGKMQGAMKNVVTAVDTGGKVAAKAAKSAGEGVSAALAEGLSGAGFTKELLKNQQAQYDTLIRDQKTFTLETLREWKNMGTSLSPVHRKMLADAAAFTGSLQAQYAKAERIRAGNTASRGAPLVNGASGLFGDNMAEAAYLRETEGGDLRSLATPKALGSIRGFVADLIIEGERVKAAYAKAYLATSEGSSALLSAMGDYYREQERLVTDLAAKKNSEIGAKLGKTEADRLFTARSVAFAAQTLAEKQSLEGSQAVLAAMGLAYSEEALLAHATTKNDEVGALLGRVEADRLFKARSAAFAAQVLAEKQSLDSSAAVLAAMGLAYSKEALLAHVATKNSEVGALIGKAEAQRLFKARSEAFLVQANLEKQARADSAEVLTSMGLAYSKEAVLAHVAAKNTEVGSLLGKTEAQRLFRARSTAFSAQTLLEKQKLQDSPATLAAMAEQYRKGETSFPSEVASVTKESTKLGRVQEALGKSQGELNKHLYEGRSAFRGLAGSVNAAYLSYGSLIPLLAGAAIGTSVASVVKLGAQVDNTFQSIRVLSEESAGSVANLNTQMLELARSGPFGPLEVAEAMKTMSLAGLSAVEVSAGIKDVLNFAVAGNTTIQNSADVLTSVASAFKISAEGYNYVADVIAKTAAVSKSSVESIGEAFKTASVINSQYGVSLEDVSLGLAALSNVGIKGTAAGTALRNTYADLYGRTDKVSAALKKLGLDARDGAGNVKPVVQIVAELTDKLGNLSKRSQDNAISTIFSERGAKAAIEMRSLFQQAAKDAGSTAENMLAEMQAKIVESAGFVIRASAEMSLTPLNQMKSVKAALEATLTESFAVISPQILQISADLKAAFASDEFKNALQSLVTGVGNLTAALARNLDTLVLVAGAVIAWKVAVGTGAFLGAAIQGVQSFKAALDALRTAKVAAAAASTAETVAGAAATASTAARVGMLGRLFAILPGVGTAIAGVATAYQLYDMFASKAKATGDVISKDESLSEYYRKETGRLDELNAALTQNITLEEYRQRQALKAAGEKADAAAGSRIKPFEDELARLEAARTKLGTNAYDRAKGPSQADVTRFDARIAQARSLRDAELERIGTEKLGVIADRERMEASAELNRALEQAEAARRNRSNTGAGVFEDDAKNGAKDRLVTIAAFQSKELEQVKAYYNSEASVIKAEEAGKKTLLKSERDNLIVSSGAYYAQEIMLTAESEKRQLELIQSSLEKAETARTNEHAGALKRLQEWDAANASKKGNKNFAHEEQQQVDALSKSIEDSNQKFKDFSKTQEDEKKKIENGALTRLKLQANEAAGELNKLTKSSKEFWDKEAENTAKNARKDNLDDMLRYASPEARAYLEAASAEQERYAEKVLEVEKQIQTASDAYLDYAANMQSAAVMTEELRKGELSQIEILKKLEEERAKLNATMGASADTAGRRAVETFAKNEEAALVKSVAGAIETGLFEGGKAGSKSLRKIITDQLRKPITMFIQASVQTLMGAITGGGGVAGAANTVNAGSSLLSGASSIASLYNVASTTMSGLVSGATTVGGILGSSAAGVSTALSYGTAIGSTQTAMLLAQEAGMGLASSMGSLGAAFAAVPVWGWIAAGVAAIAMSLDDSGTPHTGGSAAYSSGGGVKLDANKELGFTEHVSSQSHTDGAASIARGIVGLLDQTALTFGKEAGYYAATAFADDSSKDGAWGALKIKLGDSVISDWGKGNDKWPGREFGDGEAGTKEYAAAMALDVRKALDGIGLPTWATTMLDNLGAAPTIEKLEETVGAITQIQKVSELYGETLGFSTDALSSLISTMGGASAAFGSLEAYYTNFYSEEERRANLAETTADAFKKLGLTMPVLDEGARANFRSMLDAAAAQDMSVAANRTAYASLLALQGPMNDLAPSFEALAELAATRTSADIRLLEAQGKAQEALTLQRELDTVGMTAAQVAAYDYSAAIDVTIAAMSEAREIAATRTSADIRLLEAQGDAQGALTKQRELDTSGMTAAQVAAYDYAKAIDKTVESMNSAAALQSRLSVLNGSRTQTQVDRAAQLKAAPDDLSRDLLRDTYAYEDRATQVSTAFATLTRAVATAKETLSDKYNADLKELDAATTAATTAAAEAYTLQAEAAAEAYRAQAEAAADAYKAQEKAAKDSVEALQDSVSKVKDLQGNLRSALEAMTISGNEQTLRVAAQGLLSEVLTGVRAGGALPTDNPAFEKALKTLAEPSQGIFANSVDYERDFYKTRTGVEELAGLTDKALTEQEKLLELTELAIETAKEASDDALEQAKKASDDALDQAKKASDDHITALKEAGDGQKDALKKQYDADVLALDKTLERAQAQIDATNGVFTAVTSVATAINNLSAALAAVVGSMRIVAAGGSAAPGQTYTGTEVAAGIKAMTDAGASAAQIASVASTSYGITSADLARVDAATGGTALSAYQAKADAVTTLDAGGVGFVVAEANARAAAQGITPERALYDHAVSTGINAAEVDKYMGWANGSSNAWATLNGLPAFEQGINMVPYDMDARIHKGEAVVPRQFNPFNPNAKTNGGSDNSEVVAELRAVRAELAALRSQQRDGNGHAKKTADLLNRVTSGGDAMQIESAGSALLGV